MPQDDLTRFLERQTLLLEAAGVTWPGTHLMTLKCRQGHTSSPCPGVLWIRPFWQPSGRRLQILGFNRMLLACCPQLFTTPPPHHPLPWPARVWP